jgi:AAA+ ATPase superfamily predicted ATPase
MKQMERADQPLYGRRTAKLEFAPFAAWDVKHFVPAYSVRDQFLTYGIFGNLPGNLALLDAERSLAENAAALILEPTGRLVDDAEHMLDTFLGEADVHYSVLHAIAQGEQTWSGITKRVGKSSASVSRPLQWLEGMNVITRIVPITEKNPSRSKRAVYRIADPYLAFWHRLVAPLVRSGSVGLAEPHSLWEEAVASRLDDHMGPVFEQICRDYVRRPGLLPFRPFRVGEWWDSTSENQIDVVAVGARGELLLGECKWGGVTIHDLAMLKKKAGIVAAAIGSVSQIHHALFTASGATDVAVEHEKGEGKVLVFTGAEMLG